MNTELIKERMQEMKINSVELAASCGVSRESMSRIINGHNLPSIPVLRLLCITLEVSADALISIEGGLKNEQ